MNPAYYETNSPTHASATVFLQALINTYEAKRLAATGLSEKVELEKRRTELLKAKTLFDRYYYQALEWDIHREITDLPQ